MVTADNRNGFPRYDYISRTSLGELTGEILIDQALELVKKSPLPGRSSWSVGRGA